MEVTGGRKPRAVSVAALSESGEVLAMEGCPLDEQGRGRLATLPPGDATLTREWTMAGGQATVAGLKPGRWTIYVVSPEGKRWSGEAVVAAGTEAELTLTDR